MGDRLGIPPVHRARSGLNTSGERSSPRRIASIPAGASANSSAGSSSLLGKPRASSSASEVAAFLPASVIRVGRIGWDATVAACAAAQGIGPRQR